MNKHLRNLVRLSLSLVLIGIVIPEAMGQRPDRGAEKLDEERLEQSGTAITIIFDDSGSMAGRKLLDAKDAFRGWIKAAPVEYRFRLVTLNRGELVAFGRDNKAALLAAVDKIEASGGTELVRTIKDSMAAINKRRKDVGPYERQILLVFTDGQESGSTGNAGVQHELEFARQLNVESVGIGFSGDGDYMARSATRYSNANDGEQLKRSLAKVDAEIGDTSDLLIDSETLALMKTASLSIPSTANAANNNEPSTHSEASGSPGFHFGFGTLLPVLFFLFFLGRAALRITRR